MTDNDIWMEGEDSRECDDCGHTSHTCTCYEKECSYCEKVITTAMIVRWNGKYFCQGDCLDLFLDE